MAVTVSIKYDRKIPVPKNADEVMRYLSHFEVAIPTHFPGLAAFSAESPGVYRWKFKEVTYSGKTMKIEFATKLVPDQRQIHIHPVPGSGPGELRGMWKVHERTPTESDIQLDVRLSADIPVPGFLKSLVAPMVEKELSAYLDRYLNNVEKALKA